MGKHGWVLAVAFVGAAGCAAGNTSPGPYGPQPLPYAPLYASPMVVASPPIQPVVAQPLAPYQGAMVARVIRADAPDGLGLQHLGVPLDAHFEPLAGAGAVSMFPQAGPPTVTPMNEMRVDTDLVRTAEELHANAHAWFVDKGGSIGAGLDTDRRHAYYRALQLSSVYELRDNTFMTPPPPGAVYYPWRIYMGHSYWEVVDGDSHAFSARVGADFLVARADIGGFRNKYKLSSHAGGRGLVPNNGSAIFARTPPEIAAAYTASGPEAPIVVEYRQIPNSRGYDNAAIPWSEPKRVEVRFVSVAVRASSEHWRMTAICQVNGRYVDAQPTQFLDRDVSSGNFTVVFPKQLEVQDGDVIECQVSAQVVGASAARTSGVGISSVAAGPSARNVGSASTGRIDVNRLGPNGTGGQMQSGDSSASYAVTWTASLLP